MASDIAGLITGSVIMLIGIAFGFWIGNRRD